MYAGTETVFGLTGFGRGCVSMRPTFARPASVIRPSRIHFASRFLFNSDQFSLFVRGVNFRAYVVSSMRLTMLSIQPKHNASSTDSSYDMQISPICFFGKRTQTTFRDA